MGTYRRLLTATTCHAIHQAVRKIFYLSAVFIMTITEQLQSSYRAITVTHRKYDEITQHFDCITMCVSLILSSGKLELFAITVEPLTESGNP
jgi:hypothetical protein